MITHISTCVRKKYRDISFIDGGEREIRGHQCKVESELSSNRRKVNSSRPKDPEETRKQTGKRRRVMSYKGEGQGGRCERIKCAGEDGEGQGEREQRSRGESSGRGKMQAVFAVLYNAILSVLPCQSIAKSKTLFSSAHFVLLLSVCFVGAVFCSFFCGIMKYSGI